jgi:hypothetical protein
VGVKRRKGSQHKRRRSMGLSEILDVFFTSPARLPSLLEKTSKEALIECLVNILNRYANDVNSSALREHFTLIKAGYQAKPAPQKLGYNGKAANGKPCDVKPINIRSNLGSKLNGGGNFSDFTYERMNRYLADHVIMLVSGFVDGHLVYILEFPFSSLEEVIRHQLSRSIKGQRRPGQYLRSASFSFTHYKDSPELKSVYAAPNLDDFQAFLTRALYSFLKAGQ